MEREKKGKQFIRIQNLMIYFFLFSIIGWILEIIYAFYIEKSFVNRGFLLGPVCPIYGSGAVILLLFAQLLEKRKISTPTLFVASIVLLTVLEYLVSLVLELVLGIRCWDYTNEFLNFQGRVCLMFSLFFGIIGIIFLKKIYPFTNGLINKVREKIPNHVIWIVLVVSMITLLLDFTLAVIRCL